MYFLNTYKATELSFLTTANENRCVDLLRLTLYNGSFAALDTIGVVMGTSYLADLGSYI